MLFRIIVLVQVSEQGGFMRLRAFLYCFDHQVTDQVHNI